MALILAIEPNKNQAHQLNALVRAHLKAELVTAPTAAAALSALGDRVPDVVLTPALFGLRDEAALTDRLRQLGSDAAHVQTLSIPILAPASTKSGQNAGILGRKKDKADGTVGCDPAVFAEQIRIYLQRASVERRAQVSEAAARVAVSRPPDSTEAGPAAEDYSSFTVSADDLDIDSLELATIEPVAVTPPPPVAVPEPPSQENHRSRPKVLEARSAPSPMEEELGLVTPPTAGPPLWRVAESIEDFYGNGEGTDAASSNVVAERPHAAPAVAPEPVTAKPVATAAPPAPRPRRTPPQPDDWAYFEPSQGPFKALVRRLDEIAGAA